MQSQAISQRSRTAALAARSDGGVLCVACSGIVRLDAQQRRLGHDLTSGPTGVAVADDDAFYAIMRGPELDTAQLVAMSPAGEPRWSAIVGAPSNLVKVVAGFDAAYVGAARQIFTFDAATGAQRTLATGHDLLDVTRDRVFTLELESVRSATLRALDLSGNVVWSQALASTSDPFGVAGAVATPDGGIIVFGSASSSLSFGDRTLPVTTPVSFIAGFNPSGATDWLAPIPGSATNIALTTRGEILLASEQQIGGGLFSPDIDSYLSVVTPDGVLRTLPIEGRGIQSIIGLAAAPDGLAWVQVDNFPSDDGYPDPVMQVSGHTFQGEGTYVFKLVP